MIERDLTEPKRMVGELLQPGGYLKLFDLGLQGKLINAHNLRLRLSLTILFYRLCEWNRCSTSAWICSLHGWEKPKSTLSPEKLL